MPKLFFRIGLHGLYVTLDSICIFVSVFMGYGLYRVLGLGQEVVYPFSTLAVFAMFLAALVVFLMHLFGGYRRDSGILNVLEIRGVILAVLGSFALVNIIFLFARLLPSRYAIFLTFAILLLTLPLLRSLLYNILTSRMPDVLQRRVLIYGAGELGQRLYREICSSPQLGLKVMGCIDDDPAKHDTSLSACNFHKNNVCHVLGGKEDILLHIHNLCIDEIHIAMTNISNDRLKELLDHCRQYRVKVAIVPNLYNIFAHKIVLDHVGNLPLIREQECTENGSRRFVKRFMDLFCCAILGLFLLPLMLVLAVLIRRDSPGPALFKQDRVGKNGKLFHIYKFRSMYVDAPKYAVNPLEKNDPRITRIGRFLRKTSLDELPQILKVLKGDMSLVGPRPEMPFIVEQYDERQRERLRVLPGITGLWQLSGDRKEAIHENMDYDLYYIYNQSFFLDLTILFQTLIFAFRGI